MDFGQHRPPMSVGAPLVLPGVDEALYQEAEARRQRQLQREEDAWAEAQQQSKPRLNRISKALSQTRLEREVREAFERCQEDVTNYEFDESGPTISCDRLGCVLEMLGLLRGTDAEDALCNRLALLLDKKETGRVTLESLLRFLSRILDRDNQERPRAPFTSVEDACFCHLESQLSRDFSRLMSNRLSRPRADSCRRTSQDVTSDVNCEPVVLSRATMPSSAGSTARVAGASDGPEIQPCSPFAPASRMGDGCQTPLARRSQNDTGRPAEDVHRMSRCHLLYHQAMFASRENAQLEQEHRQLRAREEMRECTFKPQVLPSRRPPSPTPQPRNYDTAVARMRQAQKRRAENRAQSEHIPCGENYERLRRLGTKPFSCYSRRPSSATRRTPLMYVDVNVGHGRTGRIGVHDGDDLTVLSRNFAKTFQLDHEAEQRLQEMLHQAYEDHKSSKTTKRVPRKKEEAPKGENSMESTSQHEKPACEEVARPLQE